MQRGHFQLIDGARFTLPTHPWLCIPHGEFRRETFQANHDIPIDTGEPYGHVSGCGSLFVEILRPSGPRRQMEPGMVSLLQHSSNIPYQMVHLVTGHSRLRSHQFRLSLSSPPSCTCGEYESTRHFLFDCSLHSNARTPFKVTCLQKLSTWPPPLHVIPQIASICNTSLGEYAFKEKKRKFLKARSSNDLIPS